MLQTISFLVIFGILVTNGKVINKPTAMKNHPTHDLKRFVKHELFIITDPKSLFFFHSFDIDKIFQMHLFDINWHMYNIILQKLW